MRNCTYSASKAFRFRMRGPLAAPPAQSAGEEIESLYKLSVTHLNCRLYKDAERLYNGSQDFIYRMYGKLFNRCGIKICVALAFFMIMAAKLCKNNGSAWPGEMLIMARVISVTNQKGGVGKTTTSLALATGFMRKGFKALAVDMDPQGNLSFGLDGDTDDGPTIYDLLKGDVHPRFAVQRTSSVDLISSNILLSGVELEFTKTGREYLLKKVLTPIKDKYDYVVIDTPPALSILTVNAFAASDYVVIPMVADIFSLQGIAQLSDTILRLRQACNPELVIGGILLSKYDGRTVLSKRIKETAEMVAKQVGTRLYKTTIRNSIAIPESQTNQVNMYEYDARNPAVRDYLAFVQELLSEGV